jgi:hypothetical protein
MTRCVVGSRWLISSIMWHRQHHAVGLLGELVGPVARPYGDGQSVHPGPLDELDRLIRLRQMNFGAPDVVLDAAQSAQLALDRDAPLVGHLDDLTSNLHVVVEVRWSLAVLHKGAVHHDALKPSSMALLQVSGLLP